MSAWKCLVRIVTCMKCCSIAVINCCARKVLWYGADKPMVWLRSSCAVTCANAICVQPIRFAAKWLLCLHGNALLVMIVTCMKCVGQAGGPAPPVSFSFAFSRIGLLHNRREMLLHRWTAATATTSYVARASLCTRAIFNASVQYASNTSSEDHWRTHKHSHAHTSRLLRATYKYIAHTENICAVYFNQSMGLV